MLRPILLLFFFLLLVFPAQTHDYHTSLTEIRFNPISKTLEIVIKLFADDLETALTEKHKTRIALNKSEKTEELIAAYVKDNLAVTTQKGETLPLRFIGREPENDVVWLYLESPGIAASDLKKLSVQNSILTEIFNDQMNIVTLEIPGKKSSFLFNQSQIRHLFD